MLLVADIDLSVWCYSSKVNLRIDTQLLWLILPKILVLKPKLLVHEEGSEL